MPQNIAHLSLLVRDYDEAIQWFSRCLGFKLVEDTEQGAGKRWVLVGPAGGQGPTLLLARASTPEQAQAVGRQAGGRVFLFLHTDDFHRDYEAMKACGVTFTEKPRHEPYGMVVVFEDLYGNKWDLIEPRRV
jgi:catechol 2,3-dioxygenase-like lactoylglutathione lyase family enzyme